MHSMVLKYLQIRVVELVCFTARLTRRFLLNIGRAVPKTSSGSHLAFSNCLLTLRGRVVELLSAQAFLGQLSFCITK